MRSTRVLSVVGLTLALGLLAIPAQQASAASREKTVTLEIHGMM